jgi:hypothetical protein
LRDALAELMKENKTAVAKDKPVVATDSSPTHPPSGRGAEPAEIPEDVLRGMLNVDGR